MRNRIVYIFIQSIKLVHEANYLQYKILYLPDFGGWDTDR